MHTSRHHRKCRSNGGSSSFSNISRVDAKQHESWHNLFGNAEPRVIADIINRTWIDPDFEFICQRKSDRRYMEET